MHGNALLQQLNGIQQQFQIAEQEELPHDIVRDDALYVEFYSEINFPLKFERLNQEGNDPQFQLLTVKEEIIHENGENGKRYRVVVMMREGGVSAFIKKITAYLNGNTKDRKGNSRINLRMPSLSPILPISNWQHSNRSGRMRLNYPSLCRAKSFGGKHGSGEQVMTVQS